MAVVTVAPHRQLRISVNGPDRVYFGSRTMRIPNSGGPVTTAADVVEIMDRLAPGYVAEGLITPVQLVTVAAGQTLAIPTSNGASTFDAGSTLYLSADLAAAAKAAGTIN